MNNQLVDTLSLLGLPENEAKVYLATLELGTGSVWDISQASGVKRPTCYVILEKLASQGIAYRSNDVKRTVYSVISPKELIATFEQRKNTAAARLAELEAVASKSAYKPAIRLYEGVDGMQKVYDLSISGAGAEVLICGTAAVFDTFPEYFASYTEKRAKARIPLRFLAADTSRNRKLSSETDTAVFRSTRFLPQSDFDPKQEVLIFGDYIAYIAVLDKQPFATLIESRLFADFERQRFELLWKTAQA
jgi:sugar-specific transcriptional regulator TrmB